MGMGVHRGSVRQFFQGQTIAPGVLAPAVLDNGFRGIIQPITIREQGDQFDGAKKISPR